MQIHPHSANPSRRLYLTIPANSAAGKVARGIALFSILALAACQPAVSSAAPTISTVTITAALPQPQAVTTPRPSPTALSALLADPAALKGVKVVLWHPWAGPEDAAVRQVVEEFNNNNIWGIQASVSTHGGDKLLEDDLLKSAAADLPQLVAAPASLLGEMHADDHPLVDLTPYAADPQWGFSADEVKEFQPSFWAGDVNGGVRLGVPAWMDAHFIYYNQTWANELGFVSAPATPYDLRAQACAAAEANIKDGDKKNNGTGGWFVSNDGLAMLSWLSAFNDPGTFVNGAPFVFDTQPNRGAFIFLRTLYDHNCAWTGRSATPYEYFATRRALFYSGTLRDITTQVHIQKLLKNEDEWALLPYPTIDGKPLIMADGYSYGILPSDQPRQMAAWLLIRWLELPRNQAALAAAAGAVPASASGLQAMADFRSLNPRYDRALAMFNVFTAAPADNHWHNIRPILEDAAWQLFQPNQTLENVSAILKELDATIPVVLQQNN